MTKTRITNLTGGLCFAAFTSLFMTACSKSDNTSNSQLKVALTDAPGDFKAVYIDVQEVHVNYSDSDTNGWQTLDGVKKGRYNLLTLVNDKDTMLVDAAIKSGTIKQIRLVLGDDNWVVTRSGDSIKLQTPSGQTSGIKLKINSEVTEGIEYKMTLDFDVAKSIHEAATAGKYEMHPVIRTIVDAQGGAIKGVVLPYTIPTAVLLLNGQDTIASTYSGPNGGYLFKGIDPGTYWLHFISTDSTLPQSYLEHITVTTGQVTVADTVRLRK